MARGRFVAVAVALCASGCAAAPTARGLAEEAADAMGGVNRLRGVQTLVMRGGTGTRFRHGQTRTVDATEPPIELKNVVETLDLAGGRAALDYELALPGFTQHRREILTKKGDQPVGLENVMGRPLTVVSPSGLFSWGTQNSPAVPLRRNVITVLLAALDSASAEAPADRVVNGAVQKLVTVTLPSGEMAYLLFDPDTNLLLGFEVTDTEAMLGDVRAEYRLADYREAGGLRLPHTITVRKGGQPYSEVKFESAAVNDPAAAEVFAIPESAAAQADTAIAAGEYSPVTLTKVADGVYFARAYSHNSMVVEFPSWLAVVEGAYTEAQSATLVRELARQFPMKPIRYVVVTHHHYDHTGGVRGLAAVGATVLVEKGHEAALRTIVDSPHTNPPDALELARKAKTAGAIEVFTEKKVLSDGGRSLELYAIHGNPHVDPKVLAYVPHARALFQSDIWIPGVGAPAGPDAVHLLQAVRDLKLRVDVNVGGHGGVAPFSELEKAAAAAPPR